MADSDDPTRTADEPAGTALPPPPSRRLVAPLQQRDPDRYEVLGEHGRGGLGIVSRVHDKELGRDVAIKELISRGDIGEIRFLREALITARLEHPGIVPIHEAGRWPDGTPFYVMKLVAGRSLKELLAERTTIEARLELLPHVIAVADAVAYAHKRRIIHRDLKASNVIAGDFGETVVIDWGLAKDLAAADQASFDKAPFRAAPLDDLTAAGGPVGTPMYMPPEQQRGEAVDERADVYAIGMMLWQLCSLAQVPPPDPRARDRALRRAGIDKDLVAIIRKALAADRSDRYRDAGDLAGDLKAFKAGARISARHYSILGLLGHWTRRHRTFAITAATAIALAIAGSIVFVANITAERDRADAALTAAEAQRQRAEQAKNEIVLQNAALLMPRDPTAAKEVLDDYRGEDEVRKQMLLAEANGRGIAKAVIAPHTNTIWFLTGDASGAIFSLSEDRRIRVTREKTSTTLASDLLATGIHAHAATRGLLAYGRTPAGIAVLDLKTQAITPIEAGTSIEMDITPDGSRLAALDSRGKLTVWALSPELVAEKLLELALPEGRWVYFAGPSHLIVREKAALRAVALGAQQPGPPQAMPALSSLHVRGPDVVVGDESGQVALFSRDLTRIATVQACRQRVNSVQVAARANIVAFACQDNMVGIIRYESQGTMLVTDTFATQEPSLDARPDETGTHIVARTSSDVAYSYNTQSQLTTRYEGHFGRISFIAAPTPDFEYIAVGGNNGTARIWSVPSHNARAVLKAGQMVYSATFSMDSKLLVTGGTDGIVRRITIPDGVTTELRGHQRVVWRTIASPDGQSFLSHGTDETIRIWSPSSQSTIRIFSDHGNVGDAEYIEDGRRIASVGDDGRVLVWSPVGTDAAILFEHPRHLPLRTIETLSQQNAVAVDDSQGAVWAISLTGAVKQIRAADSSTLTVLRASSDGKFLAVGDNTGIVTVYETTNYDIVRRIALEAGVHRIQIDPHNRDLLIVAQDGNIRVITLSSPPRIPWTTLAIEALNLAYSQDGETIAFVCRDGWAWFYSFSVKHWVYVRNHLVDVPWGSFSSDGAHFASTDRNGAVVIRDMVRTFSRSEH